MSRGRAAAAIGVAALFGVTAAGTAAAGPALLPSPETPLDATVPLGGPVRGPVATEPFLLPPNPRVVNREQVTADVLADGTVVRVRVVQRLTLTGTGDFSFQIPAPLLDVRAAPGSQAEPGLRPNAIIWQGFASRRRVLAADAELVARIAARALPLRLELRATVNGRPLARGDRESGSLVLSLRLRNTTAVRTVAFTAAARPEAVRPVLARIAAEARNPPQPAVDVQGPIAGRRVVVEAPLLVQGEVRLPVSVLRGASTRGGTVVNRRGQAVLRFRRMLGGAAPADATVSLGGMVRDAGSPEVKLSARPEPFVPELENPPRDASGAELVLLAGRSLLRLARVHQFHAFLASPAPRGSTQTLYRFRTVAPSADRARAPEDDAGGSPILVFVVACGAAVVSAGAVVLWAHL